MEQTLKHIGFRDEEITYFITLNTSLTSADEAFLNELQAQYMLRTDSSMTPDEINAFTEESLQRWAESKGDLSRYTANMLFLIRCLPELHAMYQEKNWPDAMFYGICSDLTNKLRECEQVESVMGTFVFYWFHRHFKMELLALGRFQYELRYFPLDDQTIELSSDNAGQASSIVLKKGTPIYNFHIPSSGPMPLETRIDSYRRAYEFFQVPEGEYLFLECDSWLLWPENKIVFPAGTNIRDFMDDFCILTFSAPAPDRSRFSSAWRIFGKRLAADTDLNTFPQETSLQRSIWNHLNQGGCIGSGFGVIVFDGEKILTRAN